ncbi:MAG: GNAT family N-acetyltransferase [Methanomassiliicoccales archaeon]
MHEFSIRRAGLWDLEDLDRVERSAFNFGRYSRNIIAGFLKHPDAVTYVAETNRIVGSIVILFHRNSAEIASVGVVPEERKKGIATAMMKRAEAEALERNVRQLTLHVSVENTSAMKLYLKLGYQYEMRVVDYYGKGKDAYLMSRALL